MEKILDLFPSLANSSVYADVLQEFMQSCDEHQAFSTRESNAVQPFISHINNKLNDPAHRLEGLVMLNVFLPQCSDQQFIDFGISWMSQCVKGIESARCTETNETAYRVLKLLLEMSSSFTEINKNVNSLIIVKFSENLKNPGMNLNVQAAALDCVKAMISNYGAACGSQRSNFEQFIIQFADIKDPQVVSTAARCFASLPLVGSSGTSTFHKTRWLEQQQKTCYSLRLLLDQLFENIKEADVYQRGENSDKLPLDLLKNMDPVLRIYEIAERFNNLTVFLGAMLTGAFPAAKSVLPDLIIGTICRGLAINCSTLGNVATNELLALSSVLPGIHVALFGLLRSFILCLGKNLYPYGKVISKLTLQSLKWTHTAEKRYGVVRRYANVRVAACQTLALWLMTAKAGSGVASSADAILDVLAVDVLTERTAVKLTVQPGKKGSKRKELQVIETDTTIVPVKRSKLQNRTANKQPCLAALDLLYCLLHSAADQLKPTLHKAIQEIALTVAFDIQRSSLADLPIPYASRDCRLGIYKLITALTLNPHPIWPPPIQYSLEILSRGQNDDCKDVSAYCTAALAQVEKVIHPAAKTMEFPVSLEDMLKACEIDTRKPGREIRDAPKASPEKSTKSLKRTVTFDEADAIKKFRQEDECIELSSEEEGFENGLSYVESNTSVVSSNSNYQDLVLTELDDEIDGSNGDETNTDLTAPAVSMVVDLEDEIEQINLEEEENDVSFVSTNGIPMDGSPRKEKPFTNGIGRKGSPKVESPKASKPAIVPVVVEVEDKGMKPKVQGGVDKTADLQSFQGLTDEEIVNLVADDSFLPTD